MNDRRKCSTYSPKCTTIVFMLGMFIGYFIHFEQSPWIVGVQILTASLMFHLTHCSSYFSFIGRKQ